MPVQSGWGSILRKRQGTAAVQSRAAIRRGAAFLPCIGLAWAFRLTWYRLARMLSEKPWKAELILRLLLGVFVCLCLGSLVVSGVYYAGPAGRIRFTFFVLSGAAVFLLAVALVLIGQYWDLDRLIGRLLLLFCCVSSGLVLALWAQKLAGRPREASSGEQMIVGEVAVLALLVGFMRSHRLKWGAAFGFPNNPRQAVLIGATVACVFLPIAEQLQRASGYVMSRLQMQPQEQQAIHVLRETSDWSNRLYLGVLAIALAPVVEEILFRGILYPAIKQAGFPRLALWGVALLFACIHFNLVTFIPLFALALVLTALYERTNNLLAPITAHALFNALNFVLFYVFVRRSA